MTDTVSSVVPFRPRPPVPAAPLAEPELVSRLLELAKEADAAGYPHVAGLLVGAAYGVCDGAPPHNNGGHRRTA